MDRLGRQVDSLDEDVAILGETLSLFIRFWMMVTPPLADPPRGSAKAQGTERFENFVQSLGRRLASGDRFLKELSRDMPGQYAVDQGAGESADAGHAPLKNPSR
jgi:hypothetical protein